MTWRLTKSGVRTGVRHGRLTAKAATWDLLRVLPTITTLGGQNERILMKTIETWDTYLPYVMRRPWIKTIRGGMQSVLFSQVSIDHRCVVSELYLLSVSIRRLAVLAIVHSYLRTRFLLPRPCLV